MLINISYMQIYLHKFIRKLISVYYGSASARSSIYLKLRQGSLNNLRYRKVSISIQKKKEWVERETGIVPCRYGGLCLCLCLMICCTDTCSFSKQWFQVQKFKYHLRTEVEEFASLFFVSLCDAPVPWDCSHTGGARKPVFSKHSTSM